MNEMQRDLWGGKNVVSFAPELPGAIPMHTRNAAMHTLTKFLRAKTAAGLSPHTLRWYEMFVRDFLVWCERAAQGREKPDTVDEYLSHLRERKVSPATVSGCYRALSVYFKFLVQRGEIQESPMIHIQKPREPRRRMRYVTPEYFAQLYGSIQGEDWMDYRDRAIMLVLFYSGLRASELTALQWRDVDKSRRVLLVSAGKGAKARLVPYHPDLDTQLDMYYTVHPPFRSNALWLSSDGYEGIRGPMTVYALRGVLERRSQAASMEYMNPHSWRHGFAMHFLNNGMEMSAVAAAMGHSSISVTENFYAHWLTTGLLSQYNQALGHSTKR